MVCEYKNNLVHIRLKNLQNLPLLATFNKNIGEMHCFQSLNGWRLGAICGLNGKKDLFRLLPVFAFTGIALGVATLIIVMSVMNGFKANCLIVFWELTDI